MDWQALSLSLQLAFWTAAILIPLAVIVARWLAFSRARSRPLVEALLLLPLVLPPTVLGFYLLGVFAPRSALGGILASVFGTPLAFSFSGIVIASLIANIPFAVQPIARSLEAIPEAVREAGFVSGLNGKDVFRHIELPLAWPGIVTALALVFAHTLGEFGAVLMLGGNIPGQTRTLSIAIYDSVQGFKFSEAALMSAVLVVFSALAVAIVLAMSRKRALAFASERL